MTESHSLQSLAGSYPPRDRTALAELAKQYERRNQQEILDIAAIAADVTADSFLNLGLEPEIDPLVVKAFQLQYPNVEPESLAGTSQERLEGLANGIKGKYFEVLVEERLNNGESLGELTLGPGQMARIAESPTQAGWDLEIVQADDGTIIEAVQLKATTSMAYIRQALADYPDIRVAVPVEVDGIAEEIVRTDISHQDLLEVVQRQVGELSEDTMTDVLHQSAEWAFDTFPLVSAVLVAAVEGRRVLLGRSSIEDSLQRAAMRLGKSMPFSTLGAILVALDAGLLSVPTATAARVVWGRLANRVAAGEFLELKTDELRSVSLKTA